MFKSYVYSEFRSTYHKKPGDKENGCVFCKRLKEKDVIFSTKFSFIVENEYPYNYGHMLIMPIRHVEDIRQLTPEELSDLMNLSIQSIDLLEKVYDIKSFNLGLNQGPGSGATVEHLHLHVVPRWLGDSGFMETTASTRNIKETPEGTKERMKKAFNGKIEEYK